LASKDTSLVKVHFEHHQVQKEIDSLRADLSRTKRNIHAADLIVEAQEAELKKLVSIVDAADSEKDKQRKECATVLAERDLLLAQFTAREAELSQLYEKLKVQASSVEKGRYMYAQQKQVEMDTIKQVSELKRELLESNRQVCTTH
jgi:uncharacterized protein (DUF3084 family)